MNVDTSTLDDTLLSRTTVPSTSTIVTTSSNIDTPSTIRIGGFTTTDPGTTRLYTRTSRSAMSDVYTLILPSNSLEATYVVGETTTSVILSGNKPLPNPTTTSVKQSSLSDSTAASPEPSENSSTAQLAQPARKTGLSGGAIAGIVIGALIGLVLAVALLFYVLRMRRRVRELSESRREHAEPDKTKSPAGETTGRGLFSGIWEAKRDSQAGETSELHGDSFEPKELATVDPNSGRTRQ